MEASVVLDRAPDGVLDLFPHDLVRKGQDRFLEDARSCFASRTHLLAHAPTGLGKTAVSLAAGLEHSLDEGQLLFLTAKQSQHAAAIESLRRIWRMRRLSAVDVIAREHMCLARRKDGIPCQNGGACYFRNKLVGDAASRLLSFPLHVQEAMRLCLRMGTCPYLAAMRALEVADAAVCDYNQVFSLEGRVSFQRSGGEKVKAFLVVDEAHNLPTRIMDGHSFDLGEREISTAIEDVRLRRFREDLVALRHSFLGFSKGGGRKVDAWELDDALEERCGTDCAGLAQELSEEMGDESPSRSAEVVDFLRYWSAFGEGSARFLSGSPPRLHCRLLDPSLVALPALEKVHSALLMSGTLHPPEMFAEVLGIQDRCACRRYPSPFPPENRTVIAVPGVTSRFQQRSEAMYASIGRRIAEVCEHAPGNVAVFFPSYDFMNATLFQMRSVPVAKKVMVDSRELGKNEREAMVAEMRREGDRALLSSIGGSFAEGVDFHDNLLSAVVIVGVPIPPPSEDLEALLARYSSKFSPAKAKLYGQTFPALSKVLQAAGRAIRSGRDRAAIVLLDERFLLPPIASALPDDFRPLRSSNLGQELDSFFGADGPGGAEKIIRCDGVP